MNTKTRGSEKLLEVEDDLSLLTTDELDQVAGGASLSSFLAIRDYFPVGILPPDLWRQQLQVEKYGQPGMLQEKMDIPGINSISNGL